MLTVALAMAGCGTSGSPTAGSGASASAVVSAAASSSTGSAVPSASAGSCGSYAAGKNHVIRTFCDGPVDARITVAGRDYEIKGGTCVSSYGFWSVNAGVVTERGFSGRLPDYFGANLPMHGGAFSAVDFAVNVDGKGYAVKASGTMASDRKSGRFSGKEILGTTLVSGTFTC